MGSHVNMEPPIIKENSATQSYVVQGATLRCSCGDEESKLKLPEEHGIDIYDKPQANVMDYIPMTNIMPFGKCKSMANPEVAAATSANRGRLKKMPCKPVVNTPWFDGKSDTLVDGHPALLNKSTNQCKWQGRIAIEDDGQ